MFRRIAIVIAVVFAFGGAGVAEAGKKSSKSKKVKVCSTKKVGKKTKKSCRYEKEFDGHNAAKSTLRTEPLERPSGEIWVVSNNLSEEVKVNIYAADGSYDEAALAQLDEIFRCKRSHEVRAVDPRLYEQMSRIYDHFGGKRIELVSGFRFKERESSRHWHASAMDIRIEDVSIRELRDYAETLDPGGMGIGIYPNSEFVHVDFRAPGEPSYRWTDRSYPDGGGKKKSKKSKARTSPARKPTS
jgi:uncharacterized protein YcbK (DUF882 family)